MYRSKIRYVANAFVDADSIQPNASVVSELIKKLKDDQLLPIQAMEESPVGSSQRIGFQSSDGKRRLLLLGTKFSYEYLSKGEKGNDIGKFSDFCIDAVSKIGTLLKYFNRKAHRLAAMQEGFLPEMPIEQIQQVAKRLLKFPPTFSKRFPFEWDWRCASLVERSFADINELTNTIVIIRKRPKEKIIEKADYGSLRIDLDINTTHFIKVGRFSSKEIKGFFDNAPAWHDELSKEIESFIKD